MADEKRLIDANALSEEVDKSKHNNPHPPGMVRVNHRNEHDHFLRMIYDAPTVDAVEVVHGEWEPHPYHPGLVRCSKCKEQIIPEDMIDEEIYCSKCGTKLGG